MKIIKDNIDIFSDFIFHNFNNSIFDAIFPSELKNADLIPVFKKKDQNIVENYRPVSILPSLSQIYERSLYHHMYKYFNPLVMTEIWRKYVDKWVISGAILTDLSKAFDSIL